MHYVSYNFQLVMSRSATSLGLSSVPAEKVGQGELGGVSTWSSDSMAASGLSFGQHWVGHLSPPLHK